MCQFHQVAIIRRYLTSRPKLEAAKELMIIAKQEKVEIVEEFIEKQSAKIPGRPIFNEMVKRIEKGEANEWRISMP